MAEDLDDEILNNLNDSASDNSFDKTNSNDTATTSKKETENFEVNKYIHRTTDKKKWGEYLLQFVMLFLAVFLGFLSENLRERRTDTEREKQFIATFVEDLKSDTTSISEILTYRQIKSEKLDSLMLLLRTNQVKGHENELYYFGRLVIRSNVFQSNDRTITQLKNSGGLRLIRNEHAVDSIISWIGRAK
tara:strand:+ start:744 stop:1313 length:570 start_codon:yes stop_codon:yes gene_type:complete